MKQQRFPAFAWPVLAALAALVPVLGAFSTTHVFYVRDLGVYFWPRHLWLRQTVRARDWPLWDPYAGGGQSAVADALNQFFLLPVTLVRLLLPDVPGFNVWVAAPFPLMALGAWLWLRRHASAPAALVGASVFAAAGPVVSTGNFPNLSWAVAFIPWVLWSAERLVDRRSVARAAALAAFVAMQAVSGEPVTLAATGILVIAYTRSARVVGALALGALLSAVQTVPLVAAASRSPRGGGVDALFWSLHPLELAEGVVSHLFGHSYQVAIDRLPWVTGMHGREPLFFSVYVGLGALVLATVTAADGGARRWRRFWIVTAGVALLCAFGEFTPVYPALQAIVAPLQSFRFPVKYVVFSILALAALSATGADALLAHARGRATMARPVVPLALAGIVATVAAVLAAMALIGPDTALSLWSGVARAAGVDDAAGAARWLLSSSTPLFIGVAALGSGIAMLVVVVRDRHPLAAVAATTLCALAFVDPLMANRDVHPTMAASSLGPPSWAGVTRAHPQDRVYIGGRVRRLPPRVPAIEVLDTADRFGMPAELAPQEAVTQVSAQFAFVPAPWGLRESISYDLPQLWPREYAAMIDVFRWVPRDARLRFVRRTGVRYCYLPEPPVPGAQPVVAPIPLTGPMALYECEPDAQRVYVTGDARVVPDLARQLELMFDAGHDPRSVVLLDREPDAAAGRPAAPAASPSASVVGERNTELVVRAGAGTGGGFLNVLDSYDPSWRVEVDGRPATLLRANGLYRAVHLAPGEHQVRFTYRPLAFYAGLSVTLMTAFLLLVLCGLERLTGRKTARRMRQAVTA